MKITASSVLFFMVLVAIINGCVPSQDLKEISFQELSAGPPCITGSPDGMVIRSEQDYQDLRKKHAQQGPYVSFEGDGVQKSFTFPYAVVDANDDGKLSEEDFIVLVGVSPTDQEFTIDPKTGTIIFIVPPEQGQKITIGAAKGLLDEDINPIGWQKTGKKCSLADVDFSAKTML